MQEFIMRSSKSNHPVRHIVATLAVVALSGLCVATAHAVHVDGDTIIITQEDLDALARSRETTPPAKARSADTGRRRGKYSVRFEASYEFPLRDFIYWDWLESGALGVIAEVEGRIADRREEYQQVLRSRGWSEQLQRELDRIEDDIDALEEEREQQLLERILELETAPSLPADLKTELAVLHMAFALISLDDGRAKHALESITRAAKTLPTEPLVDLLRGIALREVGRNEDARDALEDALRRNSRLLLALITLAEASEDALEYDKAADLWEDAGRVRLGFPDGLERWANRNRERYPEGEASLRRVWADHLRFRLRVARLRDFAHRYYLSYEKAGYKLIYDPSVGLPPSERYLAPLRALAGRYIQDGEGAVDRREAERLFEMMRRDRDPEEFNRLMGRISDFVSTAERQIGRAIGHRPSEPPVVVLYNPNVWEALVARPSTLAFFKPHARSISIYLTPSAAPDAIKNTIYHEYAHYVTLDITGPRGMPVWLAEGLAEFLALESEYDRFVQDPVLARWRAIWSNERIGRPWFSKSREGFGVADYYKGRRAVGLLVDRFGEGGVRRFLQELGNGGDLDGASKAAFDKMSYRELLRFLVKRLPSWEGRGE